MSILSGILKRILLPQHLWRVMALQRNRKKVERVFDDAQLALYAKLLPGDFLHYGFFQDPNVDPRDLSLNDIYNAQVEYGRQIVDLISDRQNPVLDIGCGMGGLIALMEEQGLTTVALTPDKTQVKYVSQKYPHITLLNCRFEDMPSDQYRNHFGTVVTSESLQYLKLDIALPLVNSILKPGGRWISCDYFRTSTAGEKSGHNRDLFDQKLKEHGFRITNERDITDNVLPTIAYAHLWANDIGMPVKEFILEKIKVKLPGLFYAIEPSLAEIESKMEKNISTITPSVFAATKRYLLMVIERS